MKVAVLTPILDDWPAFGRLVQEISSLLADLPLAIEIVAVNDGSAQAFDFSSLCVSAGVIRSIEILHLGLNLGHQRAIAHQFLFSAFHRAIGHYRRYSASSLRALAPPGCRLAAWRMLDPAGFFASLTNGLLLGSAIPSTRQVAFWDKVLVPASRRLDPLFGYHFGKSILARWTAIQLPSPAATTVRRNRRGSRPTYHQPL
jgi:hypothetical protein